MKEHVDKYSTYFSLIQHVLEFLIKSYSVCHLAHSNSGQHITVLLEEL